VGNNESKANPLRDPDDRRLTRIAGPSSLVIFGVTGDLSRKKLMPAVYDLANRGLLPAGFLTCWLCQA
jgi:glucose-6-phosphate 1-dehydrogenase